MTNLKTSWIEIATMATGLDLKVAVHELRGTTDGPTVALTAGIHGDELLPMEIVRRVITSLDPKDVRGRVLAVPLMNPTAFETFTRHTPQDMHNLNRVFPGNADTWLSELLAAALSNYLVPQIDVLLDLHSGGAVPTVDYVYALNDMELSRSLLFPTMYKGSSYPGSFGTQLAEEAGKPVVVAEIGGGGQLEESYLRRGTDAILNALRHTRVLAGDVVKAPKQTLLTKMAIVRPRHGGILEPVVGADRLGESVPMGTLLGVLRNPQTFDVLEEFRAPFENTHLVLARGAFSKVHPGDYGYMLGDLGSAESLPAQD